MKLVLRPEAERDLAEAHVWYEKRVPGLGVEFLEAVERALETVQDNPLRYPVVHQSIRRALTRRFPYCIFFIYDRSVVSVLAVMHVARDPRKWRERTQ